LPKQPVLVRRGDFSFGAGSSRAIGCFWYLQNRE
jgi:hypothetical protein